MTFATERDTLELLLGPLELAVMRVAWRLNGPAKLSVYHLRLREWQGRALALTTVQTTLNRLAKKGYLHREGGPVRGRQRPYVYTRKMTQEDLLLQVADAVLLQLEALAPARAREHPLQRSRAHRADAHMVSVGQTP